MKCFMMFHNSEHSRVVRNKQFQHAPLQLTNIHLLVGNELFNDATKYSKKVTTPEAFLQNRKNNFLWSDF